MIIAYNLCFSTCLGRIARGNPRVLGITQLYLAPGTLPTLKDDLILAPNGIMYAPPKVGQGGRDCADVEMVSDEDEEKLYGPRPRLRFFDYLQKNGTCSLVSSILPPAYLTTGDRFYKENT